MAKIPKMAIPGQCQLLLLSNLAESLIQFLKKRLSEFNRLLYNKVCFNPKADLEKFLLRVHIIIA